MNVREFDIPEIPWWAQHHNLANVAQFLHDEGQDVTEIIYMLEKPWKYQEEYEFVTEKIEQEAGK